MIEYCRSKRGGGGVGRAPLSEGQGSSHCFLTEVSGQNDRSSEPSLGRHNRAVTILSYATTFSDTNTQTHIHTSSLSTHTRARPQQKKRSLSLVSNRFSRRGPVAAALAARAPPSNRARQEARASLTVVGPNLGPPARATRGRRGLSAAKRRCRRRCRRALASQRRASSI